MRLQRFTYTWKSLCVYLQRWSKNHFRHSMREGCKKCYLRYSMYCPSKRLLPRTYFSLTLQIILLNGGLLINFYSKIWMLCLEIKTTMIYKNFIRNTLNSQVSSRVESVRNQLVFFRVLMVLLVVDIRDYMSKLWVTLKFKYTIFLDTKFTVFIPPPLPFNEIY